MCLHQVFEYLRSLRAADVKRCEKLLVDGTDGRDDDLIQSVYVSTEPYTLLKKS
jgi:hypothetical protein